MQVLQRQQVREQQQIQVQVHNLQLAQLAQLQKQQMARLITDHSHQLTVESGRGQLQQPPVTMVPGLGLAVDPMGTAPANFETPVVSSRTPPPTASPACEGRIGGGIEGGGGGGGGGRKRAIPSPDTDILAMGAVISQHGPCTKKLREAACELQAVVSNRSMPASSDGENSSSAAERSSRTEPPKAAAAAVAYV
jgi:hypothetical protein